MLLTRHTRLWMMACLLLGCGGPAWASSFNFPSTRWIMTSAPLWPKSSEECSALNQEFYSIIRDLSAQHDECLADAPRDEIGEGGTCSKTSCQALHTARDKASKKSSEEGRICQERLQKYLDKKRKEEVEERKRQEAKEREAREDEAARSKRKADRERQDREDQAAQDKRERDKQAEREREERAERDTRAEQQKADQARWTRDSNNQPERARLEALLAQQRAQQAAEQRERDKRDSTLYDKLVKELAAAKEIKGQLSSALDFARNPFKSVAELSAEAVASSAVNLSVNPFLSDREGSNSTYDLTAMVVDSARSRALAGNPFAERMSGMAMDGVNQVHRRVLGEFDSASVAIMQFEGGSNISGPVFRPSTPAPRSGGNEVAPSPSTSYPSQNPFNTTSAASTYYDPDSSANLDVPAGHVLYRDPETSRLSVVNLTSLSNPPASGDRPELGEKGCGTTGVGIVTAECEKKRRQKANPFKAVK